MLNETGLPGRIVCPRAECSCVYDLFSLAVIFVMDVTVFLIFCWLFRKEIAWVRERFKKPEKPKGDVKVKADEVGMLDGSFAYTGGVNRRREP